MQSKKRSTSKSGRVAHLPFTTDPVPRSNPYQQPKQPFKKQDTKLKERVPPRCNIHKSILNLKVEYDRILKLMEIVLAGVRGSKGTGAGRGQESKQMNLEFKNNRTVLMSEMLVFKENLSGLSECVRMGEDWRGQDGGNKGGFMEETKIGNLGWGKESQGFRETEEYNLLKSELFDLQNICRTALAKKSLVDEEVTFQQSLILRYQELLRVGISPSKHLSRYLNLIQEYKVNLLAENRVSDLGLEQKIRTEEQGLKQEIFENRKVEEEIREVNREKDQQLRQLTDFVDTVKDSLNEMNEEYNRIKESLLENQGEMRDIMELLDIPQSDSNFFHNFILCSQKIKSLNESLLSISSTQVTVLQESSFHHKIMSLILSARENLNRNQQLQKKVTLQQKLLSQAAQQYQTVTASYIKVNNMHIDLIKSYKLVSSKVEILQNQNIEFNKLIRRIDEISEDESEEEEKQELNLICEETIVKELRKSQQEIKCKFLALKEQYRISEGVIVEQREEIREKGKGIEKLEREVKELEKGVEKYKGEVKVLYQRIEMQREEKQSLEVKMRKLEHSPGIVNSEKTELLEHITFQQSELNRLNRELETNKQSMHLLEHQYSSLLSTLQSQKTTLQSRQNQYKLLSLANDNLTATIIEQEFEINTLTDKIERKISQLEIISEQLHEARLDHRVIENEMRVMKSEARQYSSRESDKEFQLIRRDRQLNNMYLELREKQNIIRQNYLIINQLKGELETHQWNQRVERVTLLDDLKELINNPSLHLKVPVLQFISLHSDSQNLPLSQSQQQQSLPDPHPSPSKSQSLDQYTLILQQLSSDSHSFDRLDHHFENFSSKKRIEELKVSVSNELLVPPQTQKVFSTKKISAILIEKTGNEMCQFGEGLI